MKRQGTHHRSNIANRGGDPVESKRLRPAFLRWVGNRETKEALAEAGIDYAHGTAWLGERTILRADYQTKVRTLLDAAGVELSPCG